MTKALIIGAGIGGLATAMALTQTGTECEIYEAVKEIKPVGAAISIWPNGVKCLRHLGLGHLIDLHGGRMESMAYMRHDTAAALTQFSLMPLQEITGELARPIARSQLQLGMLSHWGNQHIEFGKRLTHITEEDNQVTAFFDDGSTASGDFLIAADGANSVLRAHIVGHHSPRTYAGYVNWNGLVALGDDIATPNQWTTFVGEGKRVSLMPIADGRFYFFFDVPLPVGLPENRLTLRDDLYRYFSNWAPPVQKLIGLLDPETTNRIEIHDTTPFSPIVKGRLALVGDAAHHTTPDIGQGGCMALEDAVVLGEIFARTQSGTIEDNFRTYQAARVQRTSDLIWKARKRSDTTHGKNMHITEQWYEELAQEKGQQIIAGLLQTIQSGPLG